MGYGGLGQMVWILGRRGGNRQGGEQEAGCGVGFPGSLFSWSTETPTKYGLSSQ